MSIQTIMRAIERLDEWLETMHQPGGYGGPVVHWWKHSVLYAGPAIDWKYEGVLSGYQVLYQITKNPLWLNRIRWAVEDVINGQIDDGSYWCSRFEINPGSLGTPHEAAATLGILSAFPSLQDERILVTARRNLDNLIYNLWDPNRLGFNDRSGVVGRVPNKLATLAESFLTYSQVTGQDCYLPYAKRALDGVLDYQVKSGELEGAIHQYGPDATIGDGKFFPLYNARCIPPLLKGAIMFEEDRYFQAANVTLRFIKKHMNPDGSWPQIVYRNGTKTDFPRWVAGAADILRAFVLLGEEIPHNAFHRLLNAQMTSGAFPTAQGFSSRFRKSLHFERPSFQDVLPVVGWNDKVFRLLAELLVSRKENIVPANGFKPNGDVARTTTIPVVGGTYVETQNQIQFLRTNGTVDFLWDKRQPWSKCSLELFA